MLPERVGAEGRQAAQMMESVVTTHTDQKLELLKGVPLLAGLGRRELEEVGRLIEEVDIKAGKVRCEKATPEASSSSWSAAPS